MSKTEQRSNTPFTSLLFLIFHLALGIALYHYSNNPDQIPGAKPPVAEQPIP